ncbi:MAG: hypothetical protein HZB99_02790 [Candidatus Harrisonbacteria bacterium]|nr:hypothetical protein [Candidatus Harrisonbacteria bacterium]
MSERPPKAQPKPEEAVKPVPIETLGVPQKVRSLDQPEAAAAEKPAVVFPEAEVPLASLPPAPPSPKQLAAIEKERMAEAEKMAKDAEIATKLAKEQEVKAKAEEKKVREAKAEEMMTPEEKASSEARKSGLEKKIEESRAERRGFEEPKSIQALVGKGVLDTLGSVFGARFFLEAPKLIRDYFQKKEQRGKISESTIALLEEVRLKKKELPEGVEELVTNPVAAKIGALNEQLKEAKLPAKEKLALRKEMAQILRDYRKEGKNSDKARTEKVGKVLDLYINNSVQGMVVAREAVNTASIMVMMPWLRTVGYTGLAIGERAVKAAENYEKEHFQKEGSQVEKLGFLAKNLTIDAARETFNGLTFNLFNRETKGKLQTTAEAVAAYSKLFRAVGLVEFEVALRNGTLTMREGAEKFWGAVSEGKLGEAAKQGGENWVMNARRLLSYIGLSENPEQAARKLVEAKAAATAQAEGAKISELKSERAVVEVAKLEHVRELATIHKGEGITHAFVRQLEADPASHGYNGDLSDKLALHQWAQHQAYELAVKNHFIIPSTGEEIRVLDSKDPSVYLLKSDDTVEVSNKHEYHWNPQEETRAVLEKVREHDVAVAVQIQEFHGPKNLESDMRGIYGGWFGKIGKRGAEELAVHSRLKATEVLSDDYKFTMVGEKLERSEIKNQQQLLDYIKELAKKSQESPKQGETIEEFLIRATSKLARQDIAAKLDGTEATLQDVKSIFRGKEDEEVWKVIKGISAADAEKGEFGAHVGKTLDWHEEGLRAEAKKLIEKMHKETDLPIRENESVEAYLKRAHQYLVEVAAGKKPTVFSEAAEAHKTIIKDMIDEGVRVKPIRVDGVPVLFRVNAKNEIIGVGHEGGDIMEHFSKAGKKLLKKDWLEVMHEKSSSGLVSSRQQVESGAAEVAFLKKVVDKLVRSEKGESPRARFLAKHIADTILKLEKKYGDVFK